MSQALRHPSVLGPVLSESRRGEAREGAEPACADTARQRGVSAAVFAGGGAGPDVSEGKGRRGGRPSAWVAGDWHPEATASASGGSHRGASVDSAFLPDSQTDKGIAGGGCFSSRRSSGEGGSGCGTGGSLTRLAARRRSRLVVGRLPTKRPGQAVVRGSTAPRTAPPAAGMRGARRRGLQEEVRGVQAGRALQGPCRRAGLAPAGLSAAAAVAARGCTGPRPRC